MLKRFDDRYKYFFSRNEHLKNSSLSYAWVEDANKKFVSVVDEDYGYVVVNGNKISVSPTSCVKLFETGDEVKLRSDLTFKEMTELPYLNYSMFKVASENPYLDVQEVVRGDWHTIPHLSIAEDVRNFKWHPNWFVYADDPEDDDCCEDEQAREVPEEPLDEEYDDLEEVLLSDVDIFEGKQYVNVVVGGETVFEGFGYINRLSKDQEELILLDDETVNETYDIRLTVSKNRKVRRDDE